ncbi:MAG: SDR family oxidoreductase [Calditrichia bacterium]
MDLKLNGKVAIILASSSGFGLETAKSLATEGADVVICSRNKSRLEQVQKLIENISGKPVLALPCDVSNKNSLDSFFEEVKKTKKRIDILVTNAGGPPAKFFEEVSDEEWYQAFDLNLMSVIRSIHHVLPFMKKQQWGRIVNITSVTVKLPKEELVLSNVIRAGVINLARTLATQYGKHNILINNVAPGYHSTPALDRVIDKNAQNKGVSREDIIKIFSQNVPLDRLGKPEEMAALITFLCSEKASYITGQTIIHDGGFIKTI